MAVREIVTWPDARLKSENETVSVFDARLQSLLDDMVDTMYAADGIGLAAPQVGVSLRVFVVDPEPGNPEVRPRFFVNPELVEADGEVLFEEGCLSVPGEVIEISRSERLRVAAQDRDGHRFEIDADGVLAIALQHELDHLEGKLIVDRLSSIKREMLRKKMLAAEKDPRGGADSPAMWATDRADD